MRQKFLVLTLVFISSSRLFSQTNIFPADGNVGIGTTAPISKLDIVTGVGDGSTNEANCLRLRHSSTTSNTQLLQLGVSNQPIGGSNNGYGYISSVYWGGSENSPLVLNPKGGPIGIGLTSGVLWPATVKNTVAIRADGTTANNTLMGKLVFAHNGPYGGQSSFIAGVYDKSGWYQGAGLVFNTVSGSDISGVDGVERMRISSDGNVGIGVWNPLAKLHIAGGMDPMQGASVIFDKGSMAKQFYLSFYGDNLSQAFIGQPGNVSNRLDFGTGNLTTVMTLLNDKVGIGTTTPQASLHVTGGLQQWGGYSVIFDKGPLSKQFYLGFYGDNTSQAFIGQPAGVANRMDLGTGPSWFTMTLLEDRVGIGSNTPAEKLDVNGNVKATGFILPTGAAAGMVLTSDANGNATWQTAGSSSSAGWSFNGSTVSSQQSIGTVNNYDLPVITNNTERMRVLATGAVVIGTTSLPEPDVLLAVNGNICSKKVKVSLSGWADYVFHANYRLRPLSEVEQYINQYHHLPEVPSAEEVEKKGLDVGDNQATLLKKIEELTLYVIEQQKEISALKKEVEQMKGAGK